MSRLGLAHHLTSICVRWSTIMSVCKPPPTPLVVIVGSTGTGKSQLAVELATRFNGEIINADAMQMYQGLPIVTNKITLEEQRSIPHHLLGGISLIEDTTVVGVFKREANRIIKEIRSRGRLPIVVGGTNYYIKALLFNDTLVASPDEDDPTTLPTHDHSVEHPILEDTTEAIRKKLIEVDPVSASWWHPKDRRKMRRQLEIFLTTGERASDVYARQKERKAAKASAEEESESTVDPLLFWVHTGDQTLKDRINRRVDKMLEAGLMTEITETNEHLRSRLDAGTSLDFTRGIWQSIGFKEFQPYLKSIEDGVDGEQLEKLKLECLENMKTATRRYAKYQHKWIWRQLMPLLKDDGNLNKLYVLDSTDVTQYAEQVTAKAVDVTQDFLAGNDMAEPASLSDSAREVLTEAEAKLSVKDGRCNEYCSYCDGTFVTEATWNQHIKGKSHARTVRMHKRRALVPVTKVEAEGASGTVDLESIHGREFASTKDPEKQATRTGTVCEGEAEAG